MNIGIIIDFNDIPSNGGGNSYISLFIKKVINSSGNHKVILISVFDKEKLRKIYGVSDDIIVYGLHKNYKTKLRILSRLGTILKKVYFFKQFRSYIEDRQSFFYNKSFKKMGVDCIYYLPHNRIYTTEIPFFFTVWDIGHRNINIFPEVSLDKQFYYREKLYKEVLPRAYKVVAESEAGKRDLSFYYNIKPEKIIVAPLFPGEVVTQQITAEEEVFFLKEKQLSQGKFLFYPAQFWAHKNHINLLKALKLIKEDKGIVIPLVLCGSDKGNLKYIEKKIKEYQLDSSVFVLGFVNQKDVKILYKNALALIMPTFLGPTNMPVLEAMSIGCPVICSDLEGHRECAQDSAIYFNPEDYNSIANAILLLSRDEKLRTELIYKAKDLYIHSDNKLDFVIEKVFSEIDLLGKTRDCWE